MNFEFMTIDTPLPPCMPFPRALTGFPVSSTAKVMYCRMLDAMLSKGQEDENGILFVCFPVTAIAAVLSRSPMTVKRSLNELENAGLIMRVRQGVGEPNRIYVLIPGKEDAALMKSSLPAPSSTPTGCWAERLFPACWYYWTAHGTARPSPSVRLCSPAWRCF